MMQTGKRRDPSPVLMIRAAHYRRLFKVIPAADLSGAPYIPITRLSAFAAAQLQIPAKDSSYDRQ